MKKKLSLLFVLLLSVILLAGCGKDKEEEKENVESKPTTPATILAKEFESIIKEEKDIEVVANKLSENEIFQTQMMVEKKSNKDYLNGFDEKITNFKNAYVIQPMIGSIPFVAYVFETEKVDELKSELDKNANPRWNICTEAEETVVKSVDNYVFFVMSPKSFEE